MTPRVCTVHTSCSSWRPASPAASPPQRLSPGRDLRRAVSSRSRSGGGCMHASFSRAGYDDTGLGAIRSSTSCTACRRARAPIAATPGRSARSSTRAQRSSSSHRGRATTTPTPSTWTGAPAAMGDLRPGELARYIDAHFRTIRSRSGRALVGLSAGGYGAVILGVHHLDRFAVVESWSGYFHPTDPTGTAAARAGPRRTRTPWSRRCAAAQQRLPTFFAFYVGRGDSRFRAENIEFGRELTAASVPHVFAVYAAGTRRACGGSRRRAGSRLALATSHLPQPSLNRPPQRAQRGSRTTSP